MRDTVERTYSLLSAGEQTLLARLSVFAGGFTLEAAEAVCSVEPDLSIDVRDAIASLVEKSLVRQEGAEEPRLVMPEAIREHAREALTLSGEGARLEERYAAYFLHLAERAAREYFSSHQKPWLDRLETEHNNLRAVLAWLLEHDRGSLALRVCSALQFFWSIHGHLTEGRAWLDRALEQREGADRSVIADALARAGNLASQQGDYEAARPLLEESLAIARELEDRGSIANALNNLGMTIAGHGDPEQALELFAESLAIARGLQNRRYIGAALNNLASVLREQGRYREARVLLEESLTIRRELGHSRGIARCLDELGVIAYAEGDRERARDLGEESVAIYRALGDRLGLVGALHNLGRVFREEGNLQRARQLFAESSAIEQELGRG